jgi:hypothetical protein
VLTKLLVESLGSEEDLKMLLPPPFGTNGTKKKETEEPKEPTQPKEPKPVMPGGWLLERAREGLKGTQGVTTVKDDQQKHSSLSNDERCVAGPTKANRHGDRARVWDLSDPCEWFAEDVLQRAWLWGDGAAWQVRSAGAGVRRGEGRVRAAR